VQDDDETPADDQEALLTKYLEALSETIRVPADSATKIVEAVRELLAAFPMEGGSPGPAQDTALGAQRSLPAFSELTRNPSGLSQLQSLSMLAAVVRWFSSESGLSEAEILERLGPDVQELREFHQSIIEYVTQDVRDE